MSRLAALTAAVLALAAPAAHAAPQKTVLKIATAKGMALKYSTTSLKAKAGVVALVMTNASMMPHNVAIKGNHVTVEGKVVGHGGISTVTATLKRGTYEFYCSVPGHEAAGMRGTLTVS